MAAIVDRVKLGVCLRFQQQLLRLVHHLRKLFVATNSEGEASQSARVIYFVSLTLFVSLILLSPDKILQILAAAQPDSEMLGKAQDIMKLFRKMIPI